MDIIQWLQLLTGLMSVTLVVIGWIMKHVISIESRITRLETIQKLLSKRTL